MAFISKTSTSINLTILGTKENNDTLVICKVIADKNYMSDIAVLTVQGTVHYTCICEYRLLYLLVAVSKYRHFVAGEITVVSFTIACYPATCCQNNYTRIAFHRSS